MPALRSGTSPSHCISGCGSVSSCLEVLDLSRNNCLKVKVNKSKKLFFFYFSDIWVLGWVSQPSRQQDRDRLRRDRPTGSTVQFCSCFNCCRNYFYISVPLLHQWQLRTFSLRKVEINCVRNLKRGDNNKKNFLEKKLFFYFSDVWVLGRVNGGRERSV